MVASVPDGYLVSKEALCNLCEVVMNGECTADTVSLPTQPPPAATCAAAPTAAAQRAQGTACFCYVF